MTQVAEKLQPWLAALDERPQGGPRWLQDLRDRGAARFASLGFPTTRNEEWRFTSVAAIANSEFRVTPPAPVGLNEQDLSPFVYADAAHRLVVVNGRFAPELSRVSGLPTGVRFGSLANALQSESDAVGRYLGQLADFGDRSFTALNTAFAEDGAFVLIPDRLVLESLLQIIFLSAGGVSFMTNPRTLVLAGEGSQSRIVETYVGVPGQAYFSNAVTEIAVG